MKRANSKKKRCENQVEIEFTNKPITAWGGLAAILSKFLAQVGFREWVETSVPFKERSNNAGGIYEKVLAMFLTVLVGGQRFSHVSWWGHGVQAIHAAFGVKWLPGATSTLTRFWNKISTQSMSESMSEKSRDFVRQVLIWEGICEDNLNLDSSVITRYGGQEGAKRGYNPKKHGRPSHNPLIGFIGRGYVVNLWNRSGDTHTAQSCKEFFTQTVLALGESFRVKRVLCDSGFYDIDFIKHLEKDFSYIIAVRMIENLQHKAVHDATWKRIDQGLEVGEFYFQHQDAKWDKPRRYVVVKQNIRRRPKATGKQLRLFTTEGDYRYSMMITNDEVSPPEEIWREYRPRANDENTIKDLKEGYGLACFNMNGFWATESFMVMNALVFHNLIHYLNRTILNKHTRKEHLKTLRPKWFIIPAWLGGNAGSIILRLSVGSSKVRSQLTDVFNQIGTTPHTLNCIAVEKQAQAYFPAI